MFICKVCGSEAIGRNFYVFSCESCRSFFRRYVLKNQTLYCPSNGNCIVDSKTRHLCKKCRLEKCLAVGMKKELIRSNDENQLRRLQLLERKQRVKVLPQITDSSGSDTTDNSVSAEDTNELDVMFDLIQNTPEINDKDLNKQIAEIESILTTNSALIDKYCHKMQTLTVVPIFKSLTDYNGLNQLETIRVSELLMACKVLDYPMPTNAIKVSDKEEIIRLSNRKSESMVADVITFAKRLTRFSDLCFADQLALIKYGSLELLIMCYTKFYNIEHDQFVVYLDETNSVIMKIDQVVYNDLNYLEIMRCFNSKLYPELKSDHVVNYLLMVIILFNPNRPNLIHKDCVQLEQQLYIYLLQRYLLLKYRSESESQTKLQTLMNSVKDIINMREFTITYGLDDYKEYFNHFGPLVREVYDITI